MSHPACCISSSRRRLPVYRLRDRHRVSCGVQCICGLCGFRSRRLGDCEHDQLWHPAFLAVFTRRPEGSGRGGAADRHRCPFRRSRRLVRPGAVLHWRNRHGSAVPLLFAHPFPGAISSVGRRLIGVTASHAQVSENCRNRRRPSSIAQPVESGTAAQTPDFFSTVCGLCVRPPDACETLHRSLALFTVARISVAHCLPD